MANFQTLWSTAKYEGILTNLSYFRPLRDVSSISLAPLPAQSGPSIRLIMPTWLTKIKQFASEENLILARSAILNHLMMTLNFLAVMRIQHGFDVVIMELRGWQPITINWLSLVGLIFQKSQRLGYNCELILFAFSSFQKHRWCTYCKWQWVTIKLKCRYRRFCHTSFERYGQGLSTPEVSRLGTQN